MCGILGVVRPAAAGPPSSDSINRAMRLMDHRGPDHRGFLVIGDRGVHRFSGAMDSSPEAAGPVVLSCCRLAILDLSAAGEQPMSSADGQLHLSYNGEIYNFLELRDELAALGHRFRSTSDTEVLLAAYQQWGTDCVTRLLGMFAFAIADRRRRVLFLARDHMGIKPLYYTFAADGSFFYASQMSALITAADLRPRDCPEAWREFLVRAHSDHQQTTFVRGVEQVRAAHGLEVSLDAPRPAAQTRYWRAPIAGTADLTPEQAALRLRELMEESVRLHLRSDVPVAAALSGGLDSSSVVSLMRRVQGPAAAVHTFTFVCRGTPGFDPAWDEEPWADVVGGAAQAEMHKVGVDAHRLPDECARLMPQYDGPFVSPVVLAQQQVFRAAHDAGFRVMLSGQGSDEVFAGYTRHIGARAASLLRQGKLIEFERLLRAAGRDGAGLRWPSAWLALPPALTDAIRRWRGQRLPEWLQADYVAANGAARPAREPLRTVLRGVLRNDLEVTPLPALLRYEDRNSMSVSIDNRLPFLNPRLVEFAFSLPEELLVSPDATNKWLLRRAMRGIVPDRTLDRTDQMRFPVPVAFWLIELRAWVESILKDLDAAPFLNAPVIRQRWQAFCAAGGRPIADAFLFWRAVFVVAWVRSIGMTFDAPPSRRS